MKYSVLQSVQGHQPDYAGSERDAGGEEEVPQVSPGVQVGDGHALVGPGVVAGEGGLLQAELADPGGAVDTGRVAATLHVHQQHSLVLGGPGIQASSLPQQTHPPAVRIYSGGSHHNCSDTFENPSKFFL